MGSPITFTGERFIPGIPGEIVYEHWHRYFFAQDLVKGKRVLDAACGEGYGSALLARKAIEVVGVDVSHEAIIHAKRAYGDYSNLSFCQGSVAALPLEDSSVDVIVSFETIEHLPATLQTMMLQEFSRVLSPTGIIILSSPNRPEYSPEGTPPNPFHLCELDRNELSGLLRGHFSEEIWLKQQLWFGSLLWREGGMQEVGDCRAQILITEKEGKISKNPVAPAKYFIVLATRAKGVLPDIATLSLHADQEETELKRLYHHAAEEMRLDRLACQQQGEIEQQLSVIKSIGEKSISLQKEAEIKELELQEKVKRLTADLKSCEEKLCYRSSWRGWWRFPLSRIKQKILGY